MFVHQIDRRGHPPPIRHTIIAPGLDAIGVTTQAIAPGEWEKPTGRGLDRSYSVVFVIVGRNRQGGPIRRLKPAAKFKGGQPFRLEVGVSRQCDEGAKLFHDVAIERRRRADRLRRGRPD